MRHVHTSHDPIAKELLGLCDLGDCFMFTLRVTLSRPVADGHAFSAVISLHPPIVTPL